MNMVDMGSTIRLLRLLHHLIIIVGDVVIVARETMIDSRPGRPWSINSVGLGGHCWWDVLIRPFGDLVSSLMVMKASLAVVSDLTSVVLLSLSICLILISCLRLI
jgi:hypothetical protein